MQKRNFKRTVITGLLVALPLLFMGCGKGGSRVAAQSRDEAAAKLSGPIPPGKSMQSASAGSMGKFEFSTSACRLANGFAIPLNENRDWEETISISDNQIVQDLSVNDGCRVVSTYQILGVDSSRLVLGNRTSQVTYNGSTTGTSACNDYKPNGKGPWEYNYELNGNEFSLIYPRDSRCEEGDKMQDIFVRTYY